MRCYITLHVYNITHVYDVSEEQKNYDLMEPVENSSSRKTSRWVDDEESPAICENTYLF